MGTMPHGMLACSTIGAVLVVGTLTFGAVAAENCKAPPAGTVSDIDRELRLDPLTFFERLVARYRGLTAYSDMTRITQVTRHRDDAGERETRIETEVACDIADGKLSIVTPASQLRRSLHLDLPFRQSAEMESIRGAYDLWLLPHMTLKFAEEPLEEFRQGIKEGFTATEAAEVTIDDRPMVHLELTSGDGLSGDYDARFDFYVDPESMLIERIEGRQRLPDGGDFETTYDIRPSRSEGIEPCQHEPPVLKPTCETARATQEPDEPVLRGVPEAPGEAPSCEERPAGCDAPGAAMPRVGC